LDKFKAPTVNKSAVECAGCGEPVDGEACPNCGLVVNSDPKTFYETEATESKFGPLPDYKPE
jgi:hypothetical protein